MGRQRRIESHIERLSLFVPAALSLALFMGAAAPAADPIYSDAFERPDGAVDGWTVVRGSWRLAGGKLVLQRLSSTEHWIWAGSPAAVVPANAKNVSFSFDLEFLTSGTNATVGRHGGFAFCGSTATQRGDTSFRGYFVDWIDRTEDRGLRFTRVDDGQLVEIIRGAPDSPPEPPQNWRVEVDDTNVRLFGDDVLYIDVADSTYRGGVFGFWTWEGGQSMAFDNLVVEGELEPLAACFTYSPQVPVAAEAVSFDAGCSVASGGNTITSWEWDFGDGKSGDGAVLEHAYDFPDSYTVTLTIRDAAGHSNTTSQLLEVRGQCLPFEDEFDRPAGLVDGWTAYQGEWTITEAGELHTITGGQEHWIWAGDPACLANENLTIEFDVDYLAHPAGGVGRHAGVFFFASEPGIRWGISGYDVWWIDRPGDFGISIRRWDNGAFTFLTPGTFDQIGEPPQSWRVEVSGPRIRVLGDGVQYVEVVDDTYRSGYFGFWAYANSQDVLFDNVKVTGEPPPEVIACFTAPSLALEGDSIHFDASCSVVAAQAAEYSWDFGDGQSGSGQIVDHLYPSEGSYTVVLTVNDNAGHSETTQNILRVGQALLPFADCFDRPAGPVSGWTAFQGDWSIDDQEKLGTVTQAQEHWLWAGDPPRVLSGDFVAEFTMEFLASPGDDVGRHAGAFFYSSEPTIRWAVSGYDIWWIDRAQDRGISIRRWDRGAITTLTAGTFDQVADPPLVWRLEVDGPAIRLFGDDVLYVEVEDDTYRRGYFGFWAYLNTQDVRFDDLRIGGSSLPSCDGAPQRRFVRADVDSNGDISLTDVIRILGWLYLGDRAPECTVAADTDDSGVVDISDPILVLTWLFLGGPAPAKPSPSSTGYLAADCGPVPEGGPFSCGTLAEKCQ